MDHQLGESTELMSSMKGGEGQAVGLSLVNPLWNVVELIFEASRGRPLGVSKMGPTAPILIVKKLFFGNFSHILSRFLFNTS